MLNICPICGEEFEGFGHNPDPVIFDDYEHGEESRECCDFCDSTVVIPMRMIRMKLGMTPKLTKYDAAYIVETYKTKEERDRYMEYVNEWIREEYEGEFSE